MGTLPVVARVAPHYGEEPCISGEKGSGTVFFSGCTMKCVFCQNY
jgi:putative pyruvate formate lyase activating enzyme